MMKPNYGGSMTGLITIQSKYSVKETIDRLVQIVESKEMTVFARIDHAANAEKQGMQMRPTELVVFGNPKVGTFIMQDKQTSGIDLPLKALAWQDESGKVWLTHNDSKWLLNRHDLSVQVGPIIIKIEDAMNSLTALAAN
ncbi:MAG TPA: DUF302 domain-containing protein [Puia sp.]|nr:DUF302 domain-containing protein [Puia sp.]